MLIQVFIAILLPVLVGTAILNRMGFRSLPLYARSALGYGLGLGAVVFWMMVLILLKIDLGFAVISLPLIILTAALFWMDRLKGETRQKLLPDFKRSEASVLNYLLLIFIIAQILFAYWKTLFFLPYAWDEIWNFGFKAKTIFFSKNVNDISRVAADRVYHPYFIPLAQAWSAFCLGQWSDLLTRLIYPTALAALVAVVFFFQRVFVSVIAAMTGAAILLSSLFLINHASIAYADLFMLYFNTATILLMALGFLYSGRFLVLAGCFAGIGTLVKFDAAGYLFVYYFMLMAGWRLSHKRIEKKYLFQFFIASFLIFVFSNLWRILAQIPMDLLIGQRGDYRIMDLVSGYGKAVFHSIFVIQTWGVVWSIFAISLLQLRRNFGKFEVRFLLGFVAIFLVYYFLISFTPRAGYIIGDLSSQIINRLFLHFFAIIPILIILLNVDEQTVKK